MMKGQSIDAFSGALQKLYAAANDSSLWPDALYAIEDLTGSAGATLNFVPKSSGRQGMVLAGRFTVDVCEEFARDYMAICPRTTYAVRNAPDIFYDAMLLSETEIDRDPVYNWFGTLGLRYHIGSSLPPVDGFLVNFSLQRTRREGHVQAEDIELFQRLKAHIEQAIAMSARLGSLNARQSLTDALLDSLPQGVVIVGGSGDILFANSAADRVLSWGRGLRTRGNMLEVTPPNDQRRFASLLRGAVGITQRDINGLGGWLSVEQGEGLSSLSLLIAPMTANLGVPFSMRPAAIIFIHDRDTEEVGTAAMLRGLFGLTQVEAQLAALLGHGAALEHAAAQLGHATGTGRNHLKSIFTKMNVHRQQELVHLVTGLTAQGLAGPNMASPGKD